MLLHKHNNPTIALVLAPSAKKHIVTLNPFKTFTCHACLQWVQKSLDPEDRYHNEARDAEEEFQFTGIPIAGENDGDSEESWERESWDTGDESTTDKDFLMNNFQWANWDTNDESKQREESPTTLLFRWDLGKMGSFKPEPIHSFSLQPTTIIS
jgi:hypothetical protein